MGGVWNEYETQLFSIKHNYGIVHGLEKHWSSTWVDLNQPTHPPSLISPPIPLIHASSYHQEVGLALGALS